MVYKYTVLFTQRVEIVESYQERRDCADQRIAEWISKAGFLPVPVPNNAKTAEDLVKVLGPAGIVLTGGNSLAAYGGNAPERDQVDEILIRTAIRQDIPVYGFCRGMQSILVYFGNRLEHVTGHVAVRHDIAGEINRSVNSYHNQACMELKEGCGLTCTARSEDGVVEAVRHLEYPIAATMWHPEREEGFDEDDIEMIRQLFCQETK